MNKMKHTKMKKLGWSALKFRVAGIMELMSTKLYEVCKGTETGVKQSSISLHHQLTQFQLRKREQMLQNRSSSYHSFEAALYSIKETDWNMLHQTEKRPLMGLACASCCPGSRKVPISQTENLPVLNYLKVDTPGKTSGKGLFATTFPVLKAVLETPAISKCTYPYIYDSVLQDDNVKESVHKSVENMVRDLGVTDPKGKTQLFEKEWQRAVKILNLMHSNLSNAILAFCFWLFHHIMPFMYKSVNIPRGQVEMLQKAASQGIPIVFLPLHRSHIDYIAITFTVSKSGLPAPIVAAGENLRIPFFGRLLRGLGAFFIRRRMTASMGRRDLVYKSVLHNYMIHCLQAGYNFEFYLEGGRTRTGKPCLPKGGLMSIFVDAYLSGVIDDALLIPLSINYDKIVDGNFVNELTGEPKKPETFFMALKGIWRAVTTNYGMMRLDFNQPFSLHELVRAFQNKSKNLKSGFHNSSSTASLYGTDVVVEEQRQLVDSIARHVLYDCAQSVAVMSTNALAFLLLHCYRNGVNLSQLINAFDNLRDELTSMTKDTGFTGESKDVIEYAIELLGPGLVQTEKRGEELFIKPVTILPNVIELSYYSNTVLAHFCLEGVVGRVLLSFTDEHEDSKISLDRILDLSVELCDILQYEFIFTKSCQNLNDVLFDVVDKMSTYYELLGKISIPLTPGCPRNIEFISYDDDEDRKVPSTMYKVNYREEKLQIYGNLLLPFIDTYAAIVRYLPRLIGREVVEDLLIKELLAVVKKGIELGCLPYVESLSSETIKNCLKLMEKWAVLDSHTVDGVKLYFLHSKYDQEATLEPIISRIQRFQSRKRD